MKLVTVPLITSGARVVTAKLVTAKLVTAALVTAKLPLEHVQLQQTRDTHVIEGTKTVTETSILG